MISEIWSSGEWSPVVEMALVLSNSVFIHVRKTGGSWVREAIKACAIPHEENGPYDCEYHAGVFDLPLFLASRFTFGFVRHPADWIRSAWAWAVITKFSVLVENDLPAFCGWPLVCELLGR